MTPLPTISFLLLVLITSVLQSGTSPQTVDAKAMEELAVGCQYGRLLGIEGTETVGSTRIDVRKVKTTFPHPHLTIMRVQPGKRVAKLRVDQDGNFSFASLKPGDYFFEVSGPEGKAGTMIQIAKSGAEKPCKVELRVTRAEDGLFLKLGRANAETH